MHFPSNPLQPGPLYFLTPRKCGIFGICCEAIPQQVNFLIDEYFDTGKGANTVISMLHFYLQEHGLNASCLSLNADNCAGQNKNNAMIQVCTCNAIKIIAYFCLFLVPYVEGPDKTKQVDHHLLTTWPHQIFTRLVLRPS